MGRFTDAKVIGEADDRLTGQVMLWWGHYFTNEYGTIIRVDELDNGGILVTTNKTVQVSRDNDFINIEHYTQEIVADVVRQIKKLKG